MSEPPWREGKRGVEELRTPGSVTRTVFERIVTMPDDVIAEVVNALPDDLCPPRRKNETIRFLCERRDAIKSAFPLPDAAPVPFAPHRAVSARPMRR